MATGAALIVAAIVLVGAVLPVEYGIDPVGTGALLGLVRIAPVDDEPPPGPGGRAHTLIPTQSGPIAYYPAPYAADRAQFELGPYEFLEYKYRLEKGASMEFSWSATEPVGHDFHGVPDDQSLGKEVSFDKRDRRRGEGAFTAPFSGMHGWYWENPGAAPVTIIVTSAGFYSTAVEYRSNRTRHTHELTPVR